MLVGIHTWLPYAYIYYISVYNTYMGFPGGSGGKESACYAGDLGSIPGLGRSPGEGNSYPLQYPGLGRQESDTAEQLSLSTSLYTLLSECIQIVVGFLAR